MATYGLELRDSTGTVFTNPLDSLMKYVTFRSVDSRAHNYTGSFSLSSFNLPSNVGVVAVPRCYDTTNRTSPNNWDTVDYFGYGLKTWITGTAPNLTVNYTVYDMYQLEIPGFSLQPDGFLGVVVLLF